MLWSGPSLFQPLRQALCGIMATTDRNWSFLYIQKEGWCHRCEECDGFFDQISLLKIREQKNATNVEQALNVSCAVPGEHDYAPRGFVRVVNRTVRNCIYRGASAPRHWELESRRVWARCGRVPQSFARRWSKWLTWEGCHFHEQSIQWRERVRKSAIPTASLIQFVYSCSHCHWYLTLERGKQAALTQWLELLYTVIHVSAFYMYIMCVV